MIADIPVRSRPNSSLSEHQAKSSYYLRSGNMWLHRTALFLTEKRSEAWTGTLDQARNCRRDYDAAAGCRAVPVHAVVPTDRPVEA